MDFHYEYKKLKEKLVMWFVWKMPRHLIYWATIRLWAHANASDEACAEEPNDTKFFDALDRWKTKRAINL